ncbi:MAG TPA: MG2 domain-containing protein [Syntrophorhabdaceae bacterium]|jgi:hypothetical protein
MKRNARALWMWGILLCFAGFAFAAEPSVERFTPSGTVKDVRQVTARFSDQMVSFGSPELGDPFAIDCPAKGSGRWADPKVWVYDFDEDLKSGLRCTFTLKPGLTTLAGAKVTGKSSFAFSTGGPNIKDSHPAKGGSSMAEDQIFVFRLDGPATEESILRNSSCFIEETKERVGVRVVKGAEREKVMEGLRELDRAWTRGKTLPEDMYALQCKRPFPSGATVQVKWGKGIASPSGVATTADQVFTFQVRPPFEATFGCSRERPESDCIGLLPFSLSFSESISKNLARRITLKGKEKGYPSQIEDEGDDRYVNRVTFKGPFPEKAALTLSLPRDLKDDSGRTLSNRGIFPLTVKTGIYPPLAKFSSRFGIIERADPVLPVTVRSIGAMVQGKMHGMGEEAARPGVTGQKGNALKEQITGRMHEASTDGQIISWLKKVGTVGRSRSLLTGDAGAKGFSVPKPAKDKDMEVIGIPLGKTGFYVVELKSEILGAALIGPKKPFFVPTAALVTNLSAHFKWGRDSSLVWVTSLDKAEPVAGAAVSIRDCNGKALWQGKTDSRGIAYVGKALPPAEKLAQCAMEQDEDAYYDGQQMRALMPMSSGLFAFARTADDMTFVHSGWDQGIEPYRFKLYSHESNDKIIAHTVFDRTLLRAGETIHMKHILRKAVMSGLSFPSAPLPDLVRIEHALQEEKYEFPLRWDVSKGVALTTWTIPKNARLGNYSVTLLGEAKEDIGDWGINVPSGGFQVAEFRVPLMKASLNPLDLPLVNRQSMGVDLFVEHLSGGGATDLAVKLRSKVEPGSVTFEDYEGFTIAAGDVLEGVEKRTRGFDEGEGEEAEAGSRGKELPSLELKLGAGGMARTRVAGLPLSSAPQDLITELEFRDPNGEVQTVSRRTPLFPAAVLAGVEAEAGETQGMIRIKLLSLDLKGKPLAGTHMKADLLSSSYYSHRTRLVGGFYSYQNVKEVKKIGPACEGTTDKNGMVRCEVKSPVSGQVIVRASGADGHGNRSFTHDSVFVPGKDEWWFDQGGSDRIDLIPEKKRYEPGETASFQVRMPMREATVLVTVEREGVMESFVTRISGKNPTIKVPVKGSYAPNIFVSALCVRGRIGDAKPTAMVDLGRPAYKLGIAALSVGWAAHELKVSVTPGKAVYKVREKAEVRIKVTGPKGKELPKGAEVAFAAVDEGLLELMPNLSWNLLEKMMRKRGYEVATSTAQMQVVGKRHYGQKALPRGGGGGKKPTRELFDTLLLWKAAVALDEKGEASVTVPLNDSLTSFALVAVATGGKDLFGTGRGRIQTSQDLILSSGLPTMVREGDRFRAGFLMRNTTQATLELDVAAGFTSGKERTAMSPLREHLGAGEAKEIGWDVVVPVGAPSLAWDVTARAGDGLEGDSLKVTQKVLTPEPVRVGQATLMQLTGPRTLNVEAPKDAIPGRGGVRVALKPRLSDNVNGITEYMGRYAFTCLEQQASRAIALEDQAMWARTTAAMPTYLDHDGLLKYFPSQDVGSDVLTSYILAIAHEADREIPEATRSRMEEGLKAFVGGKLMRAQPIPTADLAIRKIAAVEALSRRGAVEPKLLDSIPLDPNLWPTSAVLDWINILTRVKAIPEKDKKLRAAEQIIRSRLNFQGTTMGYSTEKGDNLWWLMTSADVNSVRTVLTFLTNAAWKQDMPGIMRGALGRQRSGRWDTTVANAWGRIALKKFGKAFEAASVTGVTVAGLGKEKKELDWAGHKSGGALLFGWPRGQASLTLSHSGSGSPWATVESLAAVPRKKPFSSGYTIKKSLIPVSRKVEGKWSVGDVVRVRLEGEAQSDMTWVALMDPIPASATILGSGLGRDSAILTSGETLKGTTRPIHEERSFEAFKAYYQYMPKGKWYVEYTMRLNNQGTFLVPATRMEALYTPEMFGEIPNASFEVKQ